MLKKQYKFLNDDNEVDKMVEHQKLPSYTKGLELFKGTHYFVLNIEKDGSMKYKHSIKIHVQDDSLIYTPPEQNDGFGLEGSVKVHDNGLTEVFLKGIFTFNKDKEVILEGAIEDNRIKGTYRFIDLQRDYVESNGWLKIIVKEAKVFEMEDEKNELKICCKFSVGGEAFKTIEDKKGKN